MRRTHTALTVAVLVALTGVGAAAPSATAAPSPRPVDVVGVGADGSTRTLAESPPGSGTMTMSGAFTTAPSAVSDGLYFVHVNTGGTLERLQFLSVVGGALELTELRYLLVMVGQPESRSAVHTPLGGSGWGTIRLLTDAAQKTGSSPAADTYTAPGRFYGIGSDGVLRRYTRTLTGTPSVRSAGTQAGFGNVRTMALYSTSATADVLLVTTTHGALSALTVPVGGTRLSATSSVLRTRGWSAFESLHAVPATTRASARVVGVDADSTTAYEYVVGALHGTATPVTSRGPWADAATSAAYVTYPVLLEATPPGG